VGELTVQPIPGNTVKAMSTKPALVLKIFELGGIKSARVDGPLYKSRSAGGDERTIVRVVFEADGTQQFASVTAMDCSPGQSFMMLHGYPKRELREPAEKVMLSATCPAPSK
jgi:hypothetical protein